MRTLTKAALVNMLCKEKNLSRKGARTYVDLFFEEISRALESGEQVKISNFGNFNVRSKAERPGCNPKTGEAMRIPPRWIASFRASKQLCNKINVAHLASNTED